MRGTIHGITNGVVRSCVASAIDGEPRRHLHVPALRRTVKIRSDRGNTIALSFFFLRGSTSPVSVTLELPPRLCSGDRGERTRSRFHLSSRMRFCLLEEQLALASHWQRRKASLAQPLCQRLLAKLLMRSASVWPAPASITTKVSTAVLREDG